MADPVSWLLIEPGWEVVDANDRRIGRVEAVTGDSGADIFDGLAIATHVFARPRYVPAEQVAEITDGRVRLTADAHSLGALSEYEEPPESLEVEPDRASRARRAEERVVARDEQRHRVGRLRRVLAFLGFAGRR
jgi:hypothetical protein